MSKFEVIFRNGLKEEVQGYGFTVDTDQNIICVKKEVFPLDNTPEQVIFDLTQIDVFRCNDVYVMK